MNRPDVVVAVDGSLYRFHPHFHDLMVEKITYLVNPGIKVVPLLKHAYAIYCNFFHGCKNDKFLMKHCDIFLIVALKHRLWVLV